MKSFRSFIAIPLFLFSGIFFANSSEITLESSVSKATVYLNAAQVTREVSASLSKGNHTIILENVSTAIDASTIQAGGNGKFVVLGISTRRNFMIDKSVPKQTKILEDSLKFIQRKISYNAGLLQVFTSERNMILKNNQIKWEKLGFAIEDLQDLSDFYRKRLTDIMSKEIEVKEFNDELLLTKNRLQGQLNELRNGQRQPSTEILIDVLVEETTNAKLNVNYIVGNAGWYPEYELFASTTSDMIDLKTKAKVYQQTGIDWSNVDLKLSTSNPRRNNNKPVITPWRLSFIQYGRALNSYSNQAYPTAIEAVSDDAAEFKMDKSVTDYTQMSESRLNFTFDVQLKYSIKGNGKAKDVNIKKDKIQAEFFHYVAPKMSQEAFVLASVSDWEKLNLMNGQVLLFLDKNFVGRSNLNTNITKKNLEFSLGVDPSITVSRTKIKDYTTSKIIGSNKEEQIGYKISIRNTRDNKINLKVEDQIPISSNKEIEVKTIDISEGKINNTSGIITWEMELLPSQGKDLVVKYNVKYPKDKPINL